MEYSEELVTCIKTLTFSENDVMTINNGKVYQEANGQTEQLLNTGTAPCRI